MLILDCHNDVYCDGLLTDTDGNLLFMSVWGRDTQISELLARLTLSDHPDGIRAFVAKDQDVAYRVIVPDVKQLDKVQGRASRSVFGDLIQLFVFSTLLHKPDRVSREAWAIYRIGQQAKPDIWPLIMETCHVPLLDHWREPVIEAFSGLGWIVHVEGYKMGALGVKLGDDHVEACISALITTRTLTLTP